MSTKTQAQSRLLNKINRVTGGQGLAWSTKDMRTDHLYYTELYELPDSVKHYPVLCQRDFLRTFNTNLRRYSSVPVAMQAAWQALKRRKEELDQLRAQSYRPVFSAEDSARLLIDKSKPLKPQIVVS